MKGKHRMIVVFSVFLLAVIASSVFIYKVSESSRDNNPQPERQIKKVEIKFFALDPRESLGKTEKMEALFEFKDDRIVIPVEVEKFKEFGNGGYFREQKWIDGLGYEQVAFNIKTPLITTFWKGGKKIKIEQIHLIYKNRNNEISDIDSIFKEGAKIELRLSSSLDLRSWEWTDKWCLEEQSEWKEDGNDTFTLAICSDYEIITPTRKVKFY